MATRGSFSPTTWNNGAAPGISAAELQRIEDQIDALDEAWTDAASLTVQTIGTDTNINTNIKRNGVNRLVFDTSGNILFYDGSSALKMRFVDSTNRWEFWRPLNMNGYVIDGVGDPTAGTHIGDRDYNDARYLALSGGTMTGSLNMGDQFIYQAWGVTGRTGYNLVLQPQTSYGLEFRGASGTARMSIWDSGIYTNVTNVITTSSDALQIDNGGTKFHGVGRIKQNSDGTLRIGFYDGSWQDFLDISDGYVGLGPEGEDEMFSVYKAKGGHSHLPYSTGAVYLTSDDDEHFYFRDYNGSSYTNRMVLTSGDDLQVKGAIRAGLAGTGALTDGYIYANPGTTGSSATATWILASGSTYYIQRYTSKREYKDDIRYDLTETLADIELKPTRHWRKDDERLRYGFIWEDLEEIDPILVDEEAPDSMAIMAVLAAKDRVKEDRLTYLERFTKEQQGVIDDYAGRLHGMERRIDALEGS